MNWPEAITLIVLGAGFFTYLSILVWVSSKYNGGSSDRQAPRNDPTYLWKTTYHPDRVAKGSDNGEEVKKNPAGQA